MCAGGVAGYGVLHESIAPHDRGDVAGGLAICLVLQLALAIQRRGPRGALPGITGDPADVASLPAALACGLTVLALHLGGRRDPGPTGLLPGLPAAAWTAVELAVLVTDRAGALLQLALLTFAPVLFVTMLLTVAAPIAALATKERVGSVSATGAELRTPVRAY